MSDDVVCGGNGKVVAFSDGILFGKSYNVDRQLG